MRQRNKSNRFRLSFHVRAQIVILILVMLPLLVTGIIFIERFGTHIEQAYGQTKIEKIALVEETLDILFDGFWDSAKQAYQDKDFQLFLSGTETLSNQDIRDVITRLNQIAYSNSLITSAYLYNMSNGQLITTDYGLTSISDYFDTSFVPLMESAKPYISIFNTRPIQQSKYENSTSNVFTLIARLPLASMSPKGALILNMREEDISDKLMGILGMDQSSAFYILEQQGSVVFTNAKTDLYKNIADIELLAQYTNSAEPYQLMTHQGVTYFVVETRIRNGSMTILALYSFESIQKMLNETLALLVGMIVLLFLANAIIVWTISLKTVKPVADLLNIAYANNAPAQKGLSLFAMKDFYVDTLTKNQALQERINESLPVLRERLCNAIFLGRLQGDPDDISRNLAAYHIELNPADLYVAVIEYDGERDAGDLTPVLIEQFLKSKLVCILCEVEPGRIAVAFDVGAFTAESVKAFFTSFKEDLDRAIGSDINISVYDRPVDITQVRDAYVTSARLLNMKYFFTKNLYFYSELEEPPVRGGSYPESIEKKLEMSLRVADLERSVEMVHEMITTIHSECSDAFGAYRMMLRLSVFLADIAAEMNIPNKELAGENMLNDIMQLKNISDIEQLFVEYVQKILMLAETKRQSRTEKYHSDILAYIDGNFQRQDLSLSLASQQLNLSMAYINQILKQYSSVTFIHCLNKRRAAEAEKLLKNKNLKVKDIAEQVGFSSPGYFIKIFKAETGFTPGECRDG